jgi:hypothetical protein
VDDVGSVGSSSTGSKALPSHVITVSGRSRQVSSLSTYPGPYLDPSLGPCMTHRGPLTLGTAALGPLPTGPFRDPAQDTSPSPILSTHHTSHPSLSPYHRCCHS